MKESEFLKKALENNMINKDKIRSKILSAVNLAPTHNFFRKKAFLGAAIAVMLIITTLVPMASIYYIDENVNLSASPQPTSDYTELYEVIENFKSEENAFNFRKFFSGITTDMMMGAAENDSAGEVADDYSVTNVQTEGLDEGDIVKTDGQYIYKLSTKGCFIISVNSGILEVIYSINIENYVPQEMYVSGNKLILIGGVYESYYYDDWNGMARPMLDCMYYINYTKTDIRIYDITEKTSPTLDRQITVDGSFNTSRLKLEDNKLFYMVNYYFYSSSPEDRYVPKISDTTINGGEETLVPAEYIYYYDDIINYSYLIIGEIDLNTPEVNSKLGVYLGLGGVIYMSAENIFVATYDYRSIYTRNILGWVAESSEEVEMTRIVKISLSTLTQTAMGRVTGSISDRYWMDEYDGYLRVATTVWNSGSYSNIFVLNPDLTLAGKIESIAPGERIYSVRFNNETGSLVTFRQMDPYFNLDLSDPENPQISAGLKEDGVSYYIHYIEDTDYTIGVGLMSETITDQWGERVVWTGLKVSLYDNSSGEAVNLKTVVLEGSCYAELFYNPKALLYDYERGLFAFAYESWNYDANNYYYSTMEQGLAVFSFDITALENDDKLTYNGTLTNMSAEIDPYDSYYGYYYNYWSFINRGIQIGDYIYTISDEFIKSYLLTTLEEVASLDLYAVVE